MFQVIKVKGDVRKAIIQLPIFERLIYSTLIEYHDALNLTFLFVFNSNQVMVEAFIKMINHLDVHFYKTTFHQAYQKKLYYDQVTDEVTPILTDHVMLTNVQLLSEMKGRDISSTIFLEVNKRRNRIRKKLSYTDINELQHILGIQHELKYVVPFYFIREMKEYYKELKIKITDLSLLYLVEYKTLQGRKR